MEIDEAVRYNRQAELISGWDQNKLKESRVVILGSDSIAELTAVGLAALGIGHLRLMDNKNKKSGFLARLTKTNSKSHIAVIGYMLAKMNDSIEIPSIHSSLVTSTSCELLGSPNVIIDATNDLKSKEISLWYGKKNKVPVIIAGADDKKGQFQTINDHQLDLNNYKKYEEKEQGFLVSVVISGLICDEVRKIAMPLEKDKPMKEIFYYNINSKERFNEIE